jgi:hypothetical protein
MGPLLNGASRRAVGMLFAAVSLCAAQPAVYPPYKNTGAWSADTLYLGAQFARITAGPVHIWLKYNEAAMVGRLSVIDPATGASHFLFLNHSGWNHPISLSGLINLPMGTPITFVYEVFGQGTWHKPPTPEDQWCPNRMEGSGCPSLEAWL